jgi:outer membrane receptor protein involved in Fe transport
MSRLIFCRGNLVSSLALCLALAPRLGAQTTPPVAATTDDKEIVTLSPFVVSSEGDDGYQAKDTLAGTRIRTDLKDVGSAVSVVTAKFLQDTNSTNSSDLLVLTTNTEVAGQGGNFAGGGDGAQITSTANYNSPVANTRVRGLAAADNLRDFFLTDIPWDSYNTGRIDLQRGPNSILYGIGSPAGVINNSVNGAAFKDANKVEFRVSSFGSARASLDLNRVVLKDELAVRLSFLDDDTQYRQTPAFRTDRRAFGALRYDPSFLNRGSAHTSFTANFEAGRVDGRNPSYTPPMDLITPWFNSLNKATYAWQDNERLHAIGDSLYNPWIGPAGANTVYDGVIQTFPTPGSPTPGISFPGSIVNYPATTDASRNGPANGQYWGIVNYSTYANQAKLPGYLLSPYKDKSLTDPRVFDFYNNLLEGPNKRNWTDFHAINLNLSQTFFNNKLGIDVAYDKQDSQWGYHNLLRDGYASISVDLISTLMDGSPNPNVGKAVVISSGSAGNGKTESLRESKRATAYGELDFKDYMDQHSVLTRILGRSVFTLSAAEQDHKVDSETWYNDYLDSGYAPNGSASVGVGTRDLDVFSYLSGDLRNSTLAAGLNLPRLTATQVPASTTVRQWNTDSLSYQTYNVPIVNPNAGNYNDATRPYVNATKHKDVVKSTTGVWQAFLFEGNLVPMIGWRKDTAESYDAGPPNKDSGVVSNFASPDWRLPTGASDTSLGGRSYNKVTGQTHTWSIVGRVPASIMKNLPGHLGLGAYYSKSENFQPNASRIDVVGDPVPSPTGRTKDYGITISALDEKIVFKIGKYETSVNDTTLSTEMGGGWAIGFIESWSQQFARHPNGGAYYGTTDAGSAFGAGHQLDYQPPDAGNHVIPGDYSSPYTQAAINAQYDIEAKAIALWLDPKNQISTKMQAAWGMSDYATGGGSISNPLVALTGDTVSRGTEFELSARPIDGLDLSINASKTDARRLNIAKSFTDWIAYRDPFIQGPAGDLRYFGSGNWALSPGSYGTARDVWDYQLLAGYKLALALNNSAVPELRPWRANATANYSFKHGSLHGVNIGGSYRWQDKQVTGFRLNSTLDGYDVSKPFYGPSDTAVDFWIGYGRQLSHKLKWRVQLNVRDLFATKKLIPITVQPDGSPAAYRIPEPRVISLTNTFEF